MNTEIIVILGFISFAFGSVGYWAYAEFKAQSARIETRNQQCLESLEKFLKEVAVSPQEEAYTRTRNRIKRLRQGAI